MTTVQSYNVPKYIIIILSSFYLGSLLPYHPHWIVYITFEIILKFNTHLLLKLCYFVCTNSKFPLQYSINYFSRPIRIYCGRPLSCSLIQFKHFLREVQPIIIKFETHAMLSLCIETNKESGNIAPARRKHGRNSC